MTKTPFLIGLVGARGYTGRELVRLISAHPECMLAYAVSREFAGRPVSDVAPEHVEGCIFEALTPDEIAARRADVVVIAAPDGAAGEYVQAINKGAAHRVIVDISADYRFDNDWAYGLPELNRDAIRGAKRIANPGCYATAAQLAVAPLLPHLDGVPSIFGVSGFSGAGSTPNPRNNVDRLKDNLMPYALVGHKHEKEASRHLGTRVRFTPHVHPAFRGIVVTAHIPIKQTMSRDALIRLYREHYAGERLIEVRDEAPELKEGTEINGVIIGGFAIDDESRHAVVVATEDNLLKGAAVQAMQNINLALGLEETQGLTI